MKAFYLIFAAFYEFSVFPNEPRFFCIFAFDFGFAILWFRFPEK
jgi:hypothetical protein